MITANVIAQLHPEFGERSIDQLLLSFRNRQINLQRFPADLNREGFTER